jgi:hypothetical protein
MSHSRTYAPSVGITAEELSQKEFQPLKWILEDFLPEGCFLLSARPKVGKSWLALQISLAVALGKSALGKKATQGKAIYLALEDSHRRLQDRLKKLSPNDYASPNLLLYTEWLSFDNGGLEQLKKLIEDEQPRLVIIDTLAKVKPEQRGPNAYQGDYNSLAPLTLLAGKYRCCIIFITHNRKGKSDFDALEQVSGTLGLTGAVDGALIIDGVRTDKQYKLSLIGRDIPNDDVLAISRISETGGWQVLGNANLVMIRTERREILELLESNPLGLKPKDISDALKKNGGAIRKMLRGMTTSQQIIDNEGVYYHPTHFNHISIVSNNGNAGNNINSYQ